MACGRRRRCGRSRLRRRYGCFHLPKIPGVKTLEAKRKDVAWLARTDPQARQIEFSEHWAKLPPREQKYIELHERAHLKTGADHDDAFFEELKRLVRENHVPWEVAYKLEVWNCHRSH